jgi:acetyl-CoA acetyltransferase
VVIVGVGETAYTRRSERSVYSLATEAIQAALDDAGIAPVDVDGMVAFPGSVFPQQVAAALGCREVGFTAQVTTGGAASVSSLGAAAMALQTGNATCVVVYGARNGSSGQRVVERVARLPAEDLRRQLEYPYGWMTPAHWYAMICRRHMHEFGTTKDHLAAVALTMRANAQRNPRAMMYGRPLTLDDYHAGKLIADPYQKFDCSLETDGAAAVVLTTADRALDTRKPSVLLAGHASALPESADDLTNRRDWLRVGLTTAAPRAFAMADTSPGEIDAAMIYDCFTFELLHQLEEVGLCPRGEAGDFVVDGHIGPGGALPVNPHGGLLSEAHLLGVNHIIEAVRQLRHEAEMRQVRGVEQVVVTGWGDLGDGSVAVLRRVS